MSAQENTSAGRDKFIRQLWLINLLLLLFCLYLLISNTPAPFNKPPLTIFLLVTAIGVCCLLSVLVWRQHRQRLAWQAADLRMLNRVLEGAYASEVFVPVPVAQTEADSVEAGWQQLRAQLAHLDVEGASAKQLKQLYLALSQCNQAIVQSQDKNSLFEQICRIIVNLGHANMAWVGELGQDRKHVHLVSAFGSGIRYLEEVLISADQSEPSGRGPCGLSLISDHPYWVNDFQTNPVSALWHEKAKQFNWKSAAFLPLHAEGKVVGCLSLYAEKAHAFDPDVRRLLQGMVANIDFALDRFEVQAQRSLFQNHLLVSEQRAQLVLENALDAIVNIDKQGLIVEWNLAAAQMFGYSRAEVIGHNLGEVIVPPAYREAHHQGMLRLQATGHSTLLGKLIEITALRVMGLSFRLN